MAIDGNCFIISIQKMGSESIFRHLGNKIVIVNSWFL